MVNREFTTNFREIGAKSKIFSRLFASEEYCEILRLLSILTDAFRILEAKVSILDVCLIRFTWSTSIDFFLREVKPQFAQLSLSLSISRAEKGETPGNFNNFRKICHTRRCYFIQEVH